MGGRSDQDQVPLETSGRRALVSGKGVLEEARDWTLEAWVQPKLFHWLATWPWVRNSFTMNLGMFPELFCIHFITWCAINLESHGNRDWSFYLAYGSLTIYNYIYMTNYQIVTYKSVLHLCWKDNCRHIIGRIHYYSHFAVEETSLREVKWPVKGHTINKRLIGKSNSDS